MFQPRQASLRLWTNIWYACATANWATRHIASLLLATQPDRRTSRSSAHRAIMIAQLPAQPCAFPPTFPHTFLLNLDEAHMLLSVIHPTFLNIHLWSSRRWNTLVISSWTVDRVLTSLDRRNFQERIWILLNISVHFKLTVAAGPNHAKSILPLRMTPHYWVYIISKLVGTNCLIKYKARIHETTNIWNNKIDKKESCNWIYMGREARTHAGLHCAIRS